LKTEQHLEGAFGKAAPVHFVWQTEHPYVAAREKQLVRRAFLPLRGRVLDLGCAEGATLLHLGFAERGFAEGRGASESEGAVGVDIFEDKLEFARTRLPKCSFVRASGYELPFENESFDHVLVRDVIHHMDEPERAVAEMHRILRPGGRVDVLEPCGRNPLIAMHALMNKAERGELRSTPAYLERLLAARFVLTETSRHQALPIHRIVFHPQMGSPKLSEVRAVAKAVDAFEKALDLLLPRAARAYIHVRAEKRS
jgi:ubiquinone/menaquinone biosynthesis C-methylase UbiE